MPHRKPPPASPPDLSRALKSPAAHGMHVAGEPGGCHTWSLARLVLPGGLRREGVAVELSERHAHLRFVSHAHLPDEGDLHLQRLGETLPARVVYQEAGEVYVEFHTPLADPRGRLAH